MTKYEYVKESIDNKYNSGEITKTEYDTLLTIIENDEDCHIEMKTSTKAGIAVGVFLGIVPGILTGVALDYLANGNILKLNKDSDAFSGDVHSKIIKVSKFNKMTKEAYRLDESKPLKIRLFHINNIPLAYCVIPNGADANSEDIEYSIIARKLRGGSFEAELKKYIQNEKKCYKTKVGIHMTKYEFCIESTNNKFDNGEITLEQYLLIIDKLNNESIENNDYHTESLKTSQKIAIGSGVFTGLETVKGLAVAQSTNDNLDDMIGVGNGDRVSQTGIVAQGVIAGLVRVFGVTLISKLVNNNRFKKLHNDVSMMNSPMSVKYIDGKSFMKLTKNTESVNKNAKVRVWHIDNVPLAYMTTFDINSGIALTDIKYKILLPTLKGGSFEEDLKSFVENEKNALKQNLKK